MDERGLVILGEVSTVLVEDLDGTKLAAVEGGEGRGEPSVKCSIDGCGSKCRHVSEFLAAILTEPP